MYKNKFLEEVENYHSEEFDKCAFITQSRDLIKTDMECAKKFLGVEFAVAVNLLNDNYYKDLDFFNCFLDYLFINTNHKNVAYFARPILEKAWNITPKSFFEIEENVKKLIKIDYQFVLDRYKDCNIFTPDIIEYFLDNNFIFSLNQVPLNVLKDNVDIRILGLNKGKEIPYDLLEFNDSQIFEDLNFSKIKVIDICKVVKYCKELSFQSIRNVLDCYEKKLEYEKGAILKLVGFDDIYMKHSLMDSWENLLNIIKDKNLEFNNFIKNIPEYNEIGLNQEKVNVNSNRLNKRMSTIIDMVERYLDIVTSRMDEKIYKSEVQHNPNLTKKMLRKF